MAGTGTKKSKSASLEVEQELREEMGQREGVVSGFGIPNPTSRCYRPRFLGIQNC